MMVVSLGRKRIGQVNVNYVEEEMAMENRISDRMSNHQIVKDFVSNFIGSLSGKTFYFTLGLMLLDQTKSAMSFGINMIIYPLVSLLFSIPIGNLVDRYRHKTILIVNFIFRIILFSLFYVGYRFMSSEHLLYIVIPFVIVHSITINLNDTCYTASIHELVNDGKIQRLSAVTQTAIALATMLSPAIGVAGYSLLGFTDFILLEIVANALSLVILLSMKFYYENENVQKEESPLDIGRGFFQDMVPFFKKNRVLLYIILVSVVLNFFYTSLSIGVPFVIKEQLELENSVIGLLETVSAVGMLAASLWMSIKPSKEGKRVLNATNILFPLLVLDVAIICLGFVFAITNSDSMISVMGSLMMGLIAFCLVVLNILVNTYLQSSIETQYLGRVMSTLLTLNTSVMPIGTLVFTYLFQQVAHGGWIFVSSGILLLLYTLVMLPRIVKIL